MDDIDDPQTDVSIKQGWWKLSSPNSTLTDLHGTRIVIEKGVDFLLFFPFFSPTVIHVDEAVYTTSTAEYRARCFFRGFTRIVQTPAKDRSEGDKMPSSGATVTSNFCSFAAPDPEISV